MQRMIRFPRGCSVLDVSRRFRGISLKALSSKTDVPDPFDSHFLNTITVENIKSSLRPWIIKCVDKTVFKELTFEEQATMFNRLLMIHCFELFLHTKYVSNRKCLFDCEIVLPALCSLIDRSLINGATSFVIGLSQLRQLTTLSKLTGESEKCMLTELLRCQKDFMLDDALEDDTSYVILDEEVVSEFIEPARDHPYDISLIGPPVPANAVYPMMMGRAKALQTVEDYGDQKVWPLFCYPISDVSSKEAFNNIVSILKDPDHSAGGTIHIFINCEPAGFEESDLYIESSSKLIKHLADMVNAPVVHVRAEEVDSVVYVMNMVSDFRANHKRDIFVNMMGTVHKPPHKNVASTRTVTQFFFEFLSGGRDSLVALYGKELISNKLLSKVELDDRKECYLRKLLESIPKPLKNSSRIASTPKKLKKPFTRARVGDLSKMVATLNMTLNNSTSEGDGGDMPGLHDESRSCSNREMTGDGTDFGELSWSCCASLAYASLLKEGWQVHVSRSMVGSASPACDPQSLVLDSINTGKFKLKESELSPLAVAGFQVGFSSAGSNILAVWEVPRHIEPSNLHDILSNYFSRMNPDERSRVIFIVPSSLQVPSSDSSTVEVSCQPGQILKICEDSDTLTSINDQLYNCNVVVANVTNPANFFHLICQHAHSAIPRALILLVPSKAECTVSTHELAENKCFLPHIGDTNVLDPNIKNAILCSGRIHQHLKLERHRRRMNGQISVSQIEQLCPFPYSDIIQDMERLPSARIWWAQEEELSDGCWNYIESQLLGLFGKERVVRFTGHYQPNFPQQSPPSLQERVSSIFDVILDS